MSAGDAALAGNADAVRDVGAWLRGRALGSAVYAELMHAAAALGAQSGAGVSMTRILTLIQTCSAPANIVQATDQSAGSTLVIYGAQMEDVARRARHARQEGTEAGTQRSRAQSDLAELDATAGELEKFMLRGGLTREIVRTGEDVAAAEARLRLLDEERRARDASVATRVGEEQGRYQSARRALPETPALSAEVRVPASMRNGTERMLSALELAELKDPALIMQAWNSLSNADRQRLIEDSPLLIGNLEGIPLRDRHTANVINARTYRQDLEHQIGMLRLMHEQPAYRGTFDRDIDRLMNEIRSIDAMLGDRNSKYEGETSGSGQPFGVYRVHNENGVPKNQDGLIIVGFNPLRDSVITFQGVLDPDTGSVPEWMEQVAVVVPGTHSSIASLTSSLERGQDLFDQSGRRSGYFIWHGAPMPQMELHDNPAKRGFAEQAGPRLASFANSLHRTSGTDFVPVAHSYGAAVLGRAELLGLRADRVVYVAPAGLGHDAQSLEDFPETGDVPHFVLQARNDGIVSWNQGKLNGLGMGHGPIDPLSTQGVTRLETGYLEDRIPTSGTIESTGAIASHSAVFTPGSTSMRNITNAVKGDPVGLYQLDERRLLPSGRGGSISTAVPGTGVAKPEQLVSSLDLSEGQR